MQILVGILVAVIAINLTSVNSFFDSFSTSNAELGGSTLARLNSSTYYLAQYKQSLFWGVGLLESSQRYAVGGGTLGDIGFLCAVVQLGVPIIMFYLCIFIRGFYVSYKVREVDRTGSNLVLSLTMLYVMFGINIDTFYGFSLSVPFYLAIVEYIGGNGRSRDFIDY